jgi:hypothetical protein
VQILTSIFSGKGTAGLLTLVQGILTIVLGMALGGPSNEVSSLSNAEEQTRGQLTITLASLAKFYKVQVIVGLLLAVTLAVRFALSIG